MTDSMHRYTQSLQAEDAMRDTDAVPTIAQHLHDENALLRRSLAVLTTRIEELEAQREDITGNAEALLQPLERVAAVLKAFYFAPLTISALQPILALALELNPEIVEQRR